MQGETMDLPRNAQVVGSSPTSGSKSPGQKLVAQRTAPYPNNSSALSCRPRPESVTKDFENGAVGLTGVGLRSPVRGFWQSSSALIG
jgi:hypothetical protein